MLSVTSIFLVLTEAVFFDLPLLKGSFLRLVYKTGLPQRQTRPANTQLAHLSCFRENCSHNPCGFLFFFFFPPLLSIFFFCLGNGLHGYAGQLDFKAGEFRCTLPELLKQAGLAMGSECLARKWGLRNVQPLPGWASQRSVLVFVLKREIQFHPSTS